MTNPTNLSLPEKFINLLMVNGKKAVAAQIFCSAGDTFLRNLAQRFPKSPAVPTPSRGKGNFLQRSQNETPLLLRLRTAVENVQPSLECRRCRVAGTSHQVPAIVSEKRGSTLAVRWIIESARKRKKHSHAPLSQCLAQELLDAYEKQGRPRQRRDQYHKLSSENRGYLRYRWW